MKEITAASLQATFRNIAYGGMQTNNFGQTIQTAIRLGLTTKADIADLMNVNPEHIFTKARSLKMPEIRSICKSLAR